LGVVNVLNDAHLVPLLLSTYLKVLKVKQLTDMVQMLLNFIDYQPHVLARFWVLSVKTVLENQLHLEYLVEI
jgi:hypothetical protein